MLSKTNLSVPALHVSSNTYFHTMRPKAQGITPETTMSGTNLHRETWDLWQDNNYVFGKETLWARVRTDLNCTQQNLTTAICRDWMYTLGLQPNMYIFKYDRRKGTIEFRFESASDRAFFKLSLG